jgi:uncharacterized lipoprotein YajG
MTTITRTICIALPLVLTAGCAESPETQVANAPATVCSRTYRMGSNIPEWICHARQTEAERQQMLDDVRKASPTGLSPPGSPGG